MPYPLTTRQDFEEEIAKIEALIFEMENEEDEIFRKGSERTIKSLREKIELGKEIMEERFKQIKLFS